MAAIGRSLPVKSLKITSIEGLKLAWKLSMGNEISLTYI